MRDASTYGTCNSHLKSLNQLTADGGGPAGESTGAAPVPECECDLSAGTSLSSSSTPTAISNALLSDKYGFISLVYEESARPLRAQA